MINKLLLLSMYFCIFLGYTTVSAEKNEVILMDITSDASPGVKLYKKGMEAYQNGQYEEAIRLTKLSAYSLIRDFEISDGQALAVMSNLANMYMQVGAYNKSLVLQEKVLNLYRIHYKDEDAETLIAMNNLSITYNKLSLYDKANELQEKVYKIRLSKLGENNKETLISMQNLAISKCDIGDYDNALLLINKVIDLRSKMEIEYKRDIVSAKNIALSVYIKKKNYRKALFFGEELVEFSKKSFGENDLDTLLVMNNLAVLYRKLGFFQKSLNLHEMVLNERNKIFHEDHPDIISSMENVAIAYSDLDRHEEALKLKRKIIEKLKGKTYKDDYKISVALNNLANTYRKIGKHEDANLLLPLIVFGFEKTRNLPNLSIEQKQSFFSEYANFYQYYTRWYAAVNRLEEAFNLGDLSKARTLTDNIRIQSALRSLPENEQIRLQKSNIRAQILQKELENAKETNTILIKHREIEAHNTDHAALLNDLQTRFPKYAQLTTIEPATVTDSRQLLQSGEVFISYLVDNNQHAQAFVLDAKGRVQWVDLGKIADDVVNIQLFRNHIVFGEDNDYSQQELKKYQSYWHKKLIAPILPLVEDAKRWIISPDKDLALLPFDTIIPNHNFSLVQSFAVYALLKKREAEYANQQYPKQLFAMGNPLYGDGWTPDRTDSEYKIKSYPNPAAEQYAMSQKSWRNLLSSGYELNQISSLFQHIANYQGLEASEHNLKKINSEGKLKDYRYLLFSAHGYLAQYPSLSALVLSQKDNPEDVDGYVTASEWPLYDLRSDLTVLSACDTGVGKTQAGESVMGLPYALFVAGNKNTLLTLWKVDDEATAEFMQRFFKKLEAGIPQPQALQQTKHEFATQTPWRHPRFWAAFVLYGV